MDTTLDAEELKRVLLVTVGQRRSAEGISIQEVANLLEAATQLQPEVKRFDEEINAELRRMANRLFRDYPNLLAELVEALAEITRDDSRDEEEEEDSEDDSDPLQVGEVKTESERRRAASALLLSALRSRARALAQGRSSSGGRGGKVLRFLADRLPPDETLLQLGSQIVTRGHLRTLIRGPRSFVMGAPQVYARFRRQRLKEADLFIPEARDATEIRRISAEETDIVILTMLTNARRLLSQRRSWQNLPDWLERIRDEYLTQVFVDEATDFSAVQLKCTMELCHPQLRSWFICGDFHQRITSYGIADRSEIDWLAKEAGASIEVRQVDIPYRQSAKLKNLADALSGRDVDQGDNTATLERPADQEVWPLLGENLNGNSLADWLSKRIGEIERTVGKLPSIAIFVDGEYNIEPLVSLLRPKLAELNIPVAGLKDARDIGDDLEVRVFDIQHIKGLEFEAVFFVGMDKLAERLPDLFDNFLYVGVSRAATYLGLSCYGDLPSKLDHIRPHFGTVDWSPSI